MSEIKRAQLIPFATQKDNEKPLKETKKTVRISVVLPESNEHTCPEYNYKDELAAAKKLGKYKESNGANGVLRPIDLDEDDDDDVRRIAKQMEEKYGTGVSLNKKKRKGRKDDYADIGMGYDESDSFIDNTDGYDEMIPQNVTTLHGGFYINSGALEFKTDDEANSDFSSSSSSDEDDNDNENDDEDDDEDNNEENDNNDENNKVKPTNRKRVIESSDETDRENKTDVDNLNQLQKKRKLQNGGNGMQQSIKKKLFNSNKIYVKKRRLVDQQKKTVKELLREKREDLNMSVPGSANTSIIVNADNNTDKEMKPIITPPTITTNGSVDNVIESVVKASTKDIEITRKSPINVNNTANIVTTISTSLMTTTATTTATTTNSTTTPPPPSSSPATIITPIKESSHDTHKVDVKLPENLPSDIVAIITTIQQLLIKYQNDIKHNDVNRMILRLERKSKCLGKPSKIKVYEYLANFANCKTEILIQRAKNLILDDEQKKLKTILSELKVEIDKIMPSLLENHDKESQRILQKKFSSESVDSEDNKSLRMPKRRFIWNDTTKKLLKDILMLKKRCLLLEGKHKETLDTRMLSFLKNDIQTLWPDGWMSMNALNKIYTTYADPKRLLNNTQPTNLTTTTTTTQNDTSTTITATATTTTSITSTTTNIKSSLKNLPHSLSNNSNLSITPVIPATKDNKNVNNNSNSVDVRNSDTMNLSRTLPEKSHCDKVESRLKVKSPSELMMKPSNHINNNNSVKKLIEADITNDDSVIIIDRVSPIKDRTLNNNNNSSSSTNNKTDHNYQVIDLSDKNELKKSNDLISKHNLNKHHEISITPNYNSTTIAMETTTTTTVTTTTTTKTIDTTTKSNCDDIQKVMEDLKALQKLSSSPKKSLIDNNIKSSSSSPSSANSSAVSVIAVNKSFTPKTSHNHHHHHQQHHHHSHHQQQQPHHSTMQRIDYVKNSDFGGGSSFQGEFQKQFLNVLNQLKPTTTTTTNKNNYNSIDTFPHIASGSGMVTNDKYYQTSSNYNQGPNGHKTTPTTSTQSGTYNIIDDMFASFLTQYGYPKEATAPKSQPK